MRALSAEMLLVMAAQRHVPRGERPIVGGFDWGAMKRRALDLLA